MLGWFAEDFDEFEEETRQLVQFLKTKKDKIDPEIFGILLTLAQRQNLIAAFMNERD